MTNTLFLITPRGVSPGNPLPGAVPLLDSLCGVLLSTAKPRPNPANHFSAQPSAHLLTNRPSVSQLTAVNHLAAVNHCILRPLTPADRQHNACGTADRGGGDTWQVLLQIYIDS